MKQGDLVRLLRQFVNTHSRKGDVGLLISVRPRESENPMGWTDHTQFTHQPVAWVFGILQAAQAHTGYFIAIYSYEPVMGVITWIFDEIMQKIGKAVFKRLFHKTEMIPE